VTPLIEVHFPRSSSPAYAVAVALARSAAEHDVGGSVTRVRFTTASLAAAVELWGLVGRWRGARLLIEGRPVLPIERWRVGEVLECAARAARVDPPARYCASGGGPIPCRYLVQTAGARLAAAVATESVAALVEETGVWACPFARTVPGPATVEAWLRWAEG